MRRLFLLFLIALPGFGQLYAQFEDSPYNELIWSDEFEGEGLPDPANWGYEVGYVRGGEYQYYTNARVENAFQKDGYLHLRAINNDSIWDKDGKLLNTTTKGGKSYTITSACIVTKDKADWRYGRFEIRAKNPICSGTWPAIWMMPSEDFWGGWPKSGEIDIMEHVGNSPAYVHFTAHTEKYNANKGTLQAYAAMCPDSYVEFHVYALEWYRDRLDWYLDGELQFTFHNDDPSKIDGAAYPFVRPFYMMLNFAFGGSWGGRDGVDETELPLDFLIDYVRVYQAKSANNDVLTTDDAVTVFPNPVTDRLNISSTGGIKEVSVCDLSGRILNTYQFAGTSIDLSSLNKGYYCLKITDSENRVSVKKIIKN